MGKHDSKLFNALRYRGTSNLNKNLKNQKWQKKEKLKENQQKEKQLERKRDSCKIKCLSKVRNKEVYLKEQNQKYTKNGNVNMGLR